MEVGYGEHPFVAGTPLDIGAAVAEAVDLVGLSRHRGNRGPVRIGLYGDVADDDPRRLVFGVEPHRMADGDGQLIVAGEAGVGGVNH